MKNLSIVFLACILAAPGAAKTFEGDVHYTMTQGKRATDVRYTIKGDRLRWEMDMGKNSMTTLYDNKSGEAVMLMPGQNMYMTLGGVKQMAESAMSKDVTVEETGRTEEIAGHKCAELIVRDGDNIIEVMATTSLGRYMDLSDLQRSRGKQNAWLTALNERELFPLRTIIKDKRGRETMRMVATKVEARPVPDATFEIPAGYQKMPGLGDLLRGKSGE